MSTPAWLVAVAAASGLVACGSQTLQDDGGDARTPPSQTRSVPPGRVEVIGSLNGDFNPAEIYRREAPGVVTVISEFGPGGSPLGLDQEGGRGLGSGFVLNGKGEIATNAHVVSNGQGARMRPARAVYVQFADGNQVSARIVGTDPNSDVGLLKVDPAGLTLRPLPLGSGRRLVVGEPVAAIGSPFGEPQSLSVGVISALNRTIESLTDFQISDAIQTDAAVNRGNSGGPLVDAQGRVLGINSQIQSTGGGGEGVGFAVPVNVVKRSLDELRRNGRVSYAYIGVSSAAVYPQLARRFDLPAERGAWLQGVQAGSPAARAGLRAGTRTVRFQARPYRAGGDVITRLDGKAIREESDLSRAIARRRAGETVEIEYYRDGRRRTARLALAERPLAVTRPSPSP
jgi:S1-C subfamily serine protease